MNLATARADAFDVPSLPQSYLWPNQALSTTAGWHPVDGEGAMELELPERPSDLARDSRWPAFFPSAMCHVTTRDGSRTALEKVVGASIVNRFPYVLALTFCRQPLSSRHHPRNAFTSMLEAGGTAAVQFLAPAAAIDRAMHAIEGIPEPRTWQRIASAGLRTVNALTVDAPVFESAYLVYEGRLVRPGRDVNGEKIFAQPWVDVGSHRIYFLEITAIQLRDSIATGRQQICWRSLPVWRGRPLLASELPAKSGAAQAAGYTKGYNANYRFPSSSTIAFESDAVVRGMAVKYLDDDAKESDNDRARWPCFFPSSLGMITTWAGRVPNLMPCGSTTVISRHPLTVAACVSYARINDRYAPRASFDLIRLTKRFGCGVPYLDERIVDAIKLAGNVSLAVDRDKVAHTGLTVRPNAHAPVLAELPVHFDCTLVGEVPMGTHMMFLGEVRRIQVRRDVTPETPLEWCPWPQVRDVDGN